MSRQSASVWYARWQEDGSKGLKAAGRAGRKPRITPEQKARVERQLARGPEAFGYATDLWTLPRITKVIKKVTGVDYHPGHVWKILKSIGWSCQKPVGKAAERDEAQIARWLKEDWPEVKKRPRNGRYDRLPRRERLLHHAKRAPHLGPQGPNPFLPPQVQLETALGHRRPLHGPDHSGKECRLFLSVRPGSVNTGWLVDYLRSLRRHIPGRVILVWDGLPSHGSRQMIELLSSQEHWLGVVRFPAYAPELNPVEYLFGNARATCLANFLPDDLSELHLQIQRHASHVRRHPDLPRAFLRHSGLF